MKRILLTTGLLALFAFSGCEEPREHWHRGGSYEGGYEGADRGYGHGEYRGHDYDYRDHSYDYNRGYSSPTRPYQGYPDQDGYPHY
jgi:hypothetical protein